MVNIDLTGKHALIMGVTNHRSLGWAIAAKLREAGAEIAFSYQGERLRGILEDLTRDMPDVRLYQVDVTREDVQFTIVKPGETILPEGEPVSLVEAAE